MTSIIKNQILKHLSTFARNLKPEQISVEVLRGKGQLRDLELNEEVLAERLELPPWLKITKAHCSCVSVKIPWTKLKSSPIQLFVEEIRLTVRLVASAIPSTKKTGLITGKPYDLAERVIEGISLHVQTIEVHFETDCQSQINFGGSIMLSQFVLESRPPNWKSWKENEAININMTRIHDKTVRQVLFFKHISWRVLKIEASANPKTTEDHYIGGQSHQRSSLNSPLRFLTENGRCQITIKKNTLDCSLIAGRVELFLQEIHWLAYMAHLRSAIDFYKHILDLANSVTKDLPLSIVKKQQQQPAFTAKVANASQQEQKQFANAFRQLDILQSSHHLTITRIDLHLCDDSSSDDLPLDWNIESGAMQAIVHWLRVDFYLQHKLFEQGNGEFAQRNSWLRYSTPNPFTELVKMQMDQHFRMLTSKMEPSTCDRFVRIWPQLVSQNVVVRIENLIIQSVSERTTKKDALRNMFSMDKRTKEKLPQSLSFIHLEHSTYSFPATDAFPVPPDSFHIVLAPFEFAPDPKSIRWLVYTLEHILNSLDAPQISNQINLPSNQEPEIRIQLLMPKLTLLPNEPKISSIPSSPDTPTKNPSELDSRLPRRFLLHATTVFLSNFTLLGDPFMPQPIMFKNKLESKHIEFIKWAERKFTMGSRLLGELQNFNSTDGMESLLDRSSADSGFAKNQWFISVPSMWINCDFGPDTWELPLLTDLDIFGCVISKPMEAKNKNPTEQSENIIILEPRTNVGLVMDHFQFVQLLELVDGMNALMDQITADRQFFHKHLTNLPDDLPLSIYCHCEKIHLRLILPVGPTPSPYDLKWSGNNGDDIISPSSTSINCSELQNDEALSVNRKKLAGNDSNKGSSSILAAGDSFTPPLRESLTPSTSLTAETIGGLAVQGGLKTIESLAEVSDITVTGKLPMEMQASRKQLVGTANLPDFIPTGVPTPSDLESISNFDDTMSITTSASNEQIMFDGTLVDADDYGEEVVEAEEVLESGSEQQQDIHLLRRKEKFLGREVNVFDFILEDFNVHAYGANGKTTALGFATNVHIGERLRENCGKIYGEKGATLDTSALSLNELLVGKGQHQTGNPMEKAKFRLELHSATKLSIIKLDLHDISICLSDELVSQLAPFIQNPTEDENPASLELSLQNCKIEIKAPKKRFPLRIKLGEVSIQDGPGKETHSCK